MKRVIRWGIQTVIVRYLCQNSLPTVLRTLHCFCSLFFRSLEEADICKALNIVNPSRSLFENITDDMDVLIIL